MQWGRRRLAIINVINDELFRMHGLQGGQIEVCVKQVELLINRNSLISQMEMSSRSGSSAPLGHTASSGSNKFVGPFDTFKQISQLSEVRDEQGCEQTPNLSDQTFQSLASLGTSNFHPIWVEQECAQIASKYSKRPSDEIMGSTNRPPRPQGNEQLEVLKDYNFKLLSDNQKLVNQCLRLKSILIQRARNWPELPAGNKLQKTLLQTMQTELKLMATQMAEREEYYQQQEAELKEANQYKIAIKLELAETINEMMFFQNEVEFLKKKIESLGLQVEELREVNRRITETDNSLKDLTTSEQNFVRKVAESENKGGLRFQTNDDHKDFHLEKKTKMSNDSQVKKLKDVIQEQDKLIVDFMKASGVSGLNSMAKVKQWAAARIKTMESFSVLTQ